MTYDFGTKQKAAGESDQGETQKFTPGEETVYYMTGNDPFVMGRLRFSPNPSSSGLAASLTAVVSEVDGGAVVATPEPFSMNDTRQGAVEWPNVEGVKYKVVVTTSHPYKCAVLWAPYKAKEDNSNQSTRGQ